MDDMTPFDRQIAAEFLRDAGPSEPVDDLAIFTAITATQSPKWRFGSMFSATKFVVAGAIVALFGGFLLASVLTAPRGNEQAPAAVTDTPVNSTDHVSTSTEPVDISGAYPDNFAVKDPGSMGLHAGGFSVTGETIEGTVTEFDDSRLNGTVRYVINRIKHNDAGDVASYVARIDNDHGSWLGTGHGYVDTADPDLLINNWNLVRDLFDTTVFRGIDGYEGLTAIMVNVPTDDGYVVTGLVFSGEIPELPEMPADAE